MKRFDRTVLGVTLLEIMLVLAIAAMVIVMSIRYYQSATSAQQVNTILQQVQGIVAAADNYAQPTGTYSGITSTVIAPLLPSAGLSTPWGGKITIGTATATGYTITIGNVPGTICSLLTPKITASKNLTISSTCGASAGDMVIKYTANP